MQPAFLKEGADEMKEPPADIFRKRVRTRGLLMGWREVNVAPTAHSSFQAAAAALGLELRSFLQQECASRSCCHGNTM